MLTFVARIITAARRLVGLMLHGDSDTHPGQPYPDILWEFLFPVKNYRLEIFRNKAPEIPPKHPGCYVPVGLT